GGELARLLGVSHCPDLDALRAAFGNGSPSPRQILVDATESSDEDLLTGAHAHAHSALQLLKRWLADDALAGHELVWVTRGAVATTDGEAPSGLAGATVHGLVRSARWEHPDRTIRLLDVDATTTAARILAA